jgi:L-lysine exporter family protein LysE/ArgO
LLIGAGVAGLAGILGDSPTLVALLTIAGSAFLVWYGIRALRRAFFPQSLRAAVGNEPLSLANAMAQAAGFTLLNPHVYLDTVLLMGSIGTRQPPDMRIWFVGGAACASGMWFTTLGFGARLLAPIFARPRAWQVLDSVVGLTMLFLAALLIRQGVSGLLHS